MDRYAMTDDCSPESVKHAKINNISTQMMKRKNFLNGIHNALNILNGLERCLQKTCKYEKQMLRCKSSHAHRHNWWESGSEDSEAKMTNKGNTKSSRNQIDLAESWSTMSIVCLQYQYEELSKRYEALLQEYDARCGALNKRDKMLAQLRKDMDTAHAQLTQAHEALLSVGDRYLVLRRKRLIQKQWYEERIEVLKRVVQEITDEMETGLGLALDDQSQDTVDRQQEVDTDLIVSEIRRCNSLFLENLHLNAEIRGSYARSGTLGSY